jgi:hypothetical protein
VRNRSTLAVVATSVLVACGLSAPSNVASPATTAGASGLAAGAGTGGGASGVTRGGSTGGDMTGGGMTAGGTTGGGTTGGGTTGGGTTGGVSGAPAANAGAGGAPAAGSGGAGSPAGSAPSFTELYNTSLASCKNVICHGGATDGPGVGLNMQTRDDAYKTLVGIMASDNGDCAGSGLLRVVPSDPDASLLMMKITRQPPCGGQMPPGGSLIAEQTDPVRAWIAAGAPDN